MGNVTFVDETTSGVRGDAWQLAVAEQRLTLRELICRRVREEVARHDAAPSARDAQEQCAQEQCAQALAAFERNGFLVLVGDEQVEDLDAELDLTFGPTVSFLKLVPLVGG